MAKPINDRGNVYTPIYYYKGDGAFHTCNVDLDGSKFSDELNYYLSTDDAVKAWANSNYLALTVTEVPSFGNNGVLRMHKVGRLVCAVFGQIDCYNFRSFQTVISSANSIFRPNTNTAFVAIIYSNDSSCYLGTVDLTSDGQMMIKYYNSISSRATCGNSGHKLFATACWTTANL